MSQSAKKMMMAEVANHSKRNHTDSYFSGKAVVTTTSSEEFGSMTSKKPRNTSPRTSPVSPKVRLLSVSRISCNPPGLFV